VRAKALFFRTAENLRIVLFKTGIKNALRKKNARIEKRLEKKKQEIKVNRFRSEGKTLNYQSGDNSP
jgi:hypothetical protein